MAFTEDIGRAAAACRTHCGQLRNRLRVLTAAAGSHLSWPEGQNDLMESFLSDVRKFPTPFPYGSGQVQRFGGFPCRLDRAAAALVVPLRVLPTGPDVLAAAIDVRSASGTLPDALRRLDETLAQGQALADALAQAAAGVRDAFAAETAFQHACAVTSRLRATLALPAASPLRAANLEFHQKQVRDLLAVTDRIPAPGPEFAAVVQALRSAVDAGDTDAVLTALDTLCRHLVAAPSPAPDWSAIQTAIAALAPLPDPDRLRAAGAEQVRTWSHEVPFCADQILARYRDLTATTPPAGPMVAPGPSPADALRAVDTARRERVAHLTDVGAGRFVLHPDAGRDRPRGP
jgi:hypothetical protein